MREICPQFTRKDRASKCVYPLSSGAGKHRLPAILMAQMGNQPGAGTLAELDRFCQAPGGNGLTQRIHIRVLGFQVGQAPTGIGRTPKWRSR